MAKIEREIPIPFESDVAKEKLIALVETLKAKYSSFLTDIKWNDEKTAADVTGKGFKGNFALNDNKLKIVADLGLALGMFKGKVETELDNKIEEFKKEGSVKV